jgi:hypothetical protein
VAEGVGFEPTVVISYSCFQDKRVKPLCHPSEMEPPVGFEPTTYSLQNCCTAAVLQGQKEARRIILKSVRGRSVLSNKELIDLTPFDF